MGPVQGMAGTVSEMEEVHLRRIANTLEAMLVLLEQEADARRSRANVRRLGSPA